MEIFQILFYEPIFNLLMWFYSFVGNLGWAILIVAVISRLITWPLTQRQIKQAESGKEFQNEIETIKKKYSKNQEKQAQELAKVQAKYLPGQLGGCLNLIIALILLVQVRNVIINLVNEGVHAFNEVAYTESLKLPEDSITVDLEKLQVGVYDIEYHIVSEGGSELRKVYTFALVDDENRDDLTDELNQKLSAVTEEDMKVDDFEESHSNIALFIPELEDIPADEPIIVDDPRPITAFIRPPSRETINYEASNVNLNGKAIPNEELVVTKGVPLDYTFAGADLSKVATDFGFSDIRTVLPYVVIAVLVGVTQLFASRVQMGLNPAMTTPSKDDKDKKKGKKGKKGKNGKEDDISFTDLLSQSTRQMTYLFPAITVIWSLGFFGAFFPTGVSLFWTGQNGFVIIQELITKREKAKERFSNFKNKFSASKETEADETVKVKVKNGKNRRNKKNNK